jgi:hypothetical protein
MQASDLTIYAIGIKNKPIKYESVATIKPLCAHSIALSNEERQALKDQGWLFDDEGANISSLNPWWGELTGVYWLLHNTDCPIVGNAQYRRYWHNEAINQSDATVLYVPETCMFPCSLAEQFRGGHSFRGIEMTMEAAEQGKLPFSVAEMSAVWQQPRFFGGPMARGPRKHYKTLMNVLFDCLWPIWNDNKEEIQSLSGYDQRAMAFLSERLLTGIILHRDKLFDDMPISCAPMCFIP